MFSTTYALKKVALLLILIGAAGVSSVFATHFRYGKLEASTLPTANGTVSFRLEIGMRQTYFSQNNIVNPVVGATFLASQANADRLAFGDGNTSVLDSTNSVDPLFTITSVDTANDTIIATYTGTHVYANYASNPSYTAFWGGCCRLSTLLGGANDQPWRVEAKVNPGRFLHSPSSALPAIINVQRGTAIQFTVPGTAYDNQVINYRLATTAESGIPTQPAGLSINPTTGVVTWNNSALAFGQYTAQFVLEGYDPNVLPAVYTTKTVVDVILNIINVTGNSPSMLINGSTISQVFNVQEGQTVSFNLTGTDPDLDPGTGQPSFVTLTGSGIPVGAITNPSLPVTGRSPVNSSFSWVATGTSRVISFTATDNTGLQRSNSVSINITPAQVPTAVAQSVNFQLTGSPVNIALQGTDPQGRSLTFSLQSSPTRGTATLAGSPTCTVSAGVSTCTQNVTYTPTGFGSDQFTFRVNNGFQNSNTATVSITSTQQPTTLTVLPASTIYGSPNPLTLQANLKSGSTPLAGRTVTFAFNSSTFGSATTDASGNASFLVNGASLSGLNGGTYPGAIAASFAGELVYAASNASATLTVSPATTSLAAPTVNSSALIGDTLTVSTTLTRVSAPAGSIAGASVVFTLTDPSSVQTTLTGTTNASGGVSVTFSPNSRGLYSVGASYAGSANFSASTSSTATVSVYQRSSLTASAASTTAGTTVTLNAALTSPPSGTPIGGQTVDFSFGGVIAPVSAVTNGSGVASVSVTFPDAGTFSYTATFLNTAGFYADHTGAAVPEVSTASVSVTPAVTSLAPLSVNPTAFLGDSLTVSTTLTRVSAPAGPIPGASVVFTLTDPSSAVTSVTGTTNASGGVTVVFSSLNVRGVYSVRASYAGTTSLSASTSNTATVTVYQRTSLTTSPVSTTAGTTVTLSAALTTIPSGAPLGGQNVDFSFGGVIPTVSAVTNASGVASVSVVFPNAGTFSYTASFLNLAGYFADHTGAAIPEVSTAAVSVAPAVTSLAPLTVNPTSLVGNPLTVSTTLTRVSAPAGAVGGASVVFTLTDPSSAQISVTGTTNASGGVMVVFSPLTSRGAYSVVASYAGSTSLSAATSGTSPVNVYQRTSLTASPASTTAGTTVTLTAVLTTPPSGVPLSGQTVDFSFGGVISPVSAVTNAAGVVSVSVVFPNAGTFSYTATFLNTAGFYADHTGALVPEVSTASVNVTAAPTSITAQAASGVYGGTVTLTATLTRTSSPVGGLGGRTITFSLNGSPVGSAVTDASGVASASFALTSTGAPGGTPINASTYAAGVGASFAGESNFSASSGTNSLTVAKADSVTTVNCPSSVTYNGSAQEPCTGNATGSGGLSTTVAPAYSNNTDVGTANASASYGGDANHNASSGSGSFAIGQASSFVTVTCPATAQTYTGAAQTPCTASYAGAGIGGPLSVSYSSNTDVGTASASASYAGDANHTGSSGSSSFTISKASSTVTVSVADVTFDGNPHGGTAAATGVGGLNESLVVTYVGRNSTVYAASTDAPTNTGDYTASASYAGSDNYTGSSGSADYTIGKAGSTTTVTCSAGPFVYNGTAYTPCTAAVNGDGGLAQMLTVVYSNNVAAGTATASTSFAGDANHTASSDAKQFTVDKANQSITFGSLNASTFGAADFTINATSSSGLTVSLMVTSGPCTLNSATSPASVHVTGAGTCSINASQGGNGNYNAASDVTRSFSIAKAAQVINFAPLPDRSYGSPDFTVSATGGGSGNPVTFVASGNCTVSGTTVHITGAGSCTVIASQAGNANYDPAADVSRSFVTAKATSAITIVAPAMIGNGSSVALSGVLTGLANAPLAGQTVVFSIGSGTATQSCIGTTNAAGAASCTLTGVNQPVGPGLPVTSAFAGNSAYQASSASTTTLVFAYAAAGGAGFVIGNLNSAVGQNVTFWGSQWSSLNALTGGTAPASFKGFANRSSTTPASCGATWTSDPGNSSNPPATIPAYMAVIVSSSITKSGSTISGNTQKVVIVRTNSGYGPDPSRTGTGTVVGVLCQ